LIILVVLGILVSGGGEAGDEIDPEAIGEIFDAIQDAAEQAEADSNGSNDSNDPNSDENSNDGNEAPPANTDSPNRPPLFPGGQQTESMVEDSGANFEEFHFGPTDAATEDLVDFYTEAYGEPSWQGTNNQGDEGTSWYSQDTGGPAVFVSSDGFDTTVQVQYDD